MTAASALDERQPHHLHRRIAHDSLFLVLTSGLTALVGMLFWVVAARTIPPVQLGVDAAVISAVTAAATVAATGIVNAFLAQVPTAGVGRGTLVRFGYAMLVVISSVAGLVAGLLIVTVLDTGLPAWPTVPLIAMGTVIWSLFIVQDSVLAATRRARWLLAENLPVNLAKLALLPVFAGLVSQAPLLSMLVPSLLAVIVISSLLGRICRPSAEEIAAADGESGHSWLRRNRRAVLVFVARDGTGSALNLGLFMALPFVVTASAGGVQGALFILCLQVAMGLDLLTSGIAQSMTANTAVDPSRAGVMAWQIWRRVALLVGAALAVLVLIAPFLLGMFGETYVAEGGVAVLLLLAVGSLLRTTFEVWTALMRVRHRTAVLLVANLMGAALLLPAVILGARSDGAIGAAWGVLAGTAVLSVVGFVGLLRARRPR